MRAMQHALLSVFHPSSSAPFISLECLGMSVINYSFLFSPTGAHFKIAEYSQVITLTRTDLKTDCILCVFASGKQSKKKNRKKSRHQLHPPTSVTPSQDTAGSEINPATAPKIERGPPLEQDAACVGTSGGHCGQQSYSCSATGPPGGDAHSFIQLALSREKGHTQKQMCTHLKALPIGRSSACFIW